MSGIQEQPPINNDNVAEGAEKFSDETIAANKHVYEGSPDGRQSDSVDMPTSRFRPRYRALTPEEKALHDAIKTKAAELESLFDQVKPGRYRSLGITALEEAVMWTVKELTS